MPHTIRGYFLIILLIVLVGYAIFAGRNYLRGLSLAVIEPPDNASIHDSYLTVIGTADRVSHLSVNGAPVAPQRDGSWSYALLLPLGYSIINIEATDRFGRSRQIERAVYYSPSATSTATSTNKLSY